MTRKSCDKGGRTAVFAGSFDPFTIGHHDIVMRGLALFDRIVICVGVNADKSGKTGTALERVESIRRVYACEPRVEVASWSGLTVDFAHERDACALLRGIRSVKDFEYERNLADANLRIGSIETVLLYSSPEYSWVSSSLVRELMSYGRDVSSMLPPGVFSPV